MSHISTRKIISSFSLMSGASLLTIFLGIVTTKFVAVFGGLQGIGTFDLFRKLLGLIVPILAAGMTTVIVQNISTSDTTEKIIQILKSVFNLLIVQVLIAVYSAIFLAEYAADWLFSTDAHKYINEVRIVFIMSMVVLFSQTMVALINGKINLKKVTFINIVTSFSTMILAYPLLTLGTTGLALMVGSGSIVGASVGIFYVRKVYQKELSEFQFTVKIKDYFKSLPVSIWLLIHPLIVSAALLNIQVMVNKYYGLDALGLYASVTMIETTFVMVLMAAMNTYYMPTLGHIADNNEKKLFVNKVISLLIVGVFPIIIGMILIGKYILWILFSEKFTGAANLLAIQSMSMLTAVFCWCYANYLLHNKRYKIYFAIDVVWVSILTGLVWFVASNNYPLLSIPVAYLLSSIVSFVLYISVIMYLYGKEMLGKRNIFLLGYGLISIYLFYFSWLSFGLQMQIIFIIIIGVGYYIIMKSNYNKVIG